MYGSAKPLLCVFSRELVGVYNTSTPLGVAINTTLAP